MVIKQDVRGRFDSEGEFYAFQHEAEDGFDTVEWAASRPYSNGQVGMWGGSYVGATQMLAAMAHPPHLVAIFPYVTASEYYEGWTYQHGALMQWFATSWSSGLAVDTLRRKAQDRVQERLRGWEKERSSPLSGYPLLDLPAPADLAPYFHDWLAHETSDDYWRRVKVSDHYPEMTVKALHGGGWHDVFLRGSIENYLGLKAKAATAEAREGQRLLLGPWAHAATSPEGRIGDVVFGKDAVLAMTTTLRSWMDYALKGVANEFAARPPVRVFVMGENAWRDETEFPPARARATRYYLQPGSGRADGMLVEKAPGSARAQSYDYDPDDPAPSGRSSRGPTCWCSRPRPWRATWRRPGGSAWSSSPPHQRWTPTSPPSSPTWTRPATRASSPMAWCAAGTATRRRPRHCSSRAGSTSTRSTCGRRATSSRPATASGSTSRAATSPASTATGTRASRSWGPPAG
ncbi:MAG: hypothetical protein DMF81_25985 [Acidobacteria bacterium]|nr:MAG: hypothetical protein DMF81_25985 [Acidobacteriota bacterium]